MRGFLRAVGDRGDKMDLAKRTHLGETSTTTMSNVARDASTQMSTPRGLLELFKLQDSLSGQPSEVAKNLLSQISSGNIDPAFVVKVLPIIGGHLPLLIKQPQGLALLKLLNNLYTNHRLDLTDFERLGLDEEAKKNLKTFKQQYDAQGINGVDIQNLQSMIGKIKFDTLGELGEPLKRLLNNVLEKRVFTIAMFEEAIKGTYAIANRPKVDENVHDDSPLNSDSDANL